MKLNILLTEDFPYPVEKVWSALADSDALRVWLMDNDFEPRLGKRFILRGRQILPRGRGWIECEVLALERPSRMLWSWIHNDGDPPTHVEFRLDPISQGTRLTLSHTGEIDAELERSLRRRWPGKLADMRAHLSRSI
jgi:uncharacterized protein YndB with AHSA1/START domain